MENLQNLMEQMVKMQEMQMQMMNALVQTVANSTPNTNTVATKVDNVVNTNTNFVPTDKNQVLANDYEKSVDRSNFETKRVTVNQLDDMDWKEVKRTQPEMVSIILSDIKTDIMTSKSPNDYAEVFEKYRTEALQDYYVRTQMNNNCYDPEFDNVDSLSRKELTSLLYQIELENWVARQLKKKGATDESVLAPSDKQMELLKKNNVDITGIKYWFQASKILDELFGSYDKTPTKRQIELIAKLVGELELQGYDMTVADKKQATEKIEELYTLHEQTFGKQMPTDEQKELVKRYIKMLGKKQTKAYKAELANMSSREMSKHISELKKEYNALHPEASEGQVTFIATLCEMLMLPYDMESLRTLTKEQATAKITELKTLRVFGRMRREMVSITLDELKKLSKDELDVKYNEYFPKKSK